MRGNKKIIVKEKGRGKKGEIGRNKRKRGNRGKEK